MLFRDNPVLIRELLVTLRSPRAFVLQLLYVCALGGVVYFYWPAGEGSVAPGQGRPRSRGLFDIFFLGQFFLVALMAPTFAAGSITGEKERKTYELLLASPLRPGDDPRRQAAQLAQLPGDPDHLQPAADDPLLPAGRAAALGDHASYLVLILAAGTFGLLSIACSSFFSRTSSALVVSYLVILPLAVVCVVLTRDRQRAGVATSSRSRCCRRGAWRSGRSSASSSTAGCSIRPTSAARARTSSTRRRR